ncbi:hypothetical protein BHE74_00021612 [Ensete ventricosum]|nr:hypothetical protein BHE74_00021612 [Ensete ventricosum]
MKQDTVLTSCKVPDKERVYSGGFKASVLVRCMWSPLLSHHRSKPTVPVATANISSDNEQTSAADPPITVERRYTVASGVVAPYDVAVTKAAYRGPFVHRPPQPNTPPAPDSSVTKQILRGSFRRDPRGY